MTSPAAPFGPWSPNVDPVKRIAQLRSLAAVSVGPGHRLVGELRASETDRDAAARALPLLDALPSQTRRRLIATFGAITFRPAPPRKPGGGAP